MRRRGKGRPPKFRFGAIVVDPDGQTWVMVDRRVKGTKSQYRGIRLTGGRRRFGPAKWMPSNILVATGERSTKGSVLTYRANEGMKAELGGRGCECQCCIHTALPRSGFKRKSGEWKEDEE